MGEPSDTMGHMERMAQPLHIQRLERGLALQPFLNYAEKIFKDSSSDDSDGGGQGASYNGLMTTRDERRSDKARLFNVDSVRGEREGLRDVLLSGTSSDSLDGENSMSEERFQEMLKQHVLEKKLRLKFYNKASNAQYHYYGTGLLSNYDKFPEHQESIVGTSVDTDQIKGRKREGKDLRGESSKIRKGKRMLKKENSFNDSLDQDDFDTDEKFGDDFDDEYDSKYKVGRGRGKRKDKTKSPEVMAMRRRKLWAMMAKKEIAKSQRSKVNNHKEMVTTCKKVAQMCIKHWKQKALQSQKNMKETIWRNKRLAREMQAYWKRYERVERDARRRQEKEAEEQRKMDVEFMEAKRQQRKLNFLITQTELYAHFISKKLAGDNEMTGNEKKRILSQLDEEVNLRLAIVDDYNSAEMKAKAARNVEHAVSAERARTRAYELSALPDPSAELPDERPQPNMFRGTLKHYQMKGMNWLANLYDQGINGILADEMGLGKTVQSVAFLCHIAEKYSVWGPFLIISPASTLHNWQQEIQRFVPDFKVVPYWGSVQERRILRQFWDQKDLHTKDASFHVVITSYQLVISDFKYFNRIKWQYLILDEAQAIKSSNSMRWKLLLGFSCRNRLLLSGTPIQNSMAELWALLHFIMPTLFDNHDEFSEWFSKDIEGQAENKSRIDEKHLSRLHLILKPFMLRRIKKDVENELSDKIEVMVYCPLTTRQKLLYSGLKQKIRVEDLLAGISGRPGATSDDPGKNVANSLMNLVMQFRKVCNHPELFERREARSPFYWPTVDYIVPKLVYEYGLLWRTIPSIKHLLENALSIFTVENIRDSSVGCFSFLRFIGLSMEEANSILTKGILWFWLSLEIWRHTCDVVQHASVWENSTSSSTRLLVAPEDPLLPPNSERSPVMNGLIFRGIVGEKGKVYTHTKHVYHSMAETLEHRVMRSQKLNLHEMESLSESLISPKSLSPRTEVAHVSDGKRIGKGAKSPVKSSPNSEGSSQDFLVPEFPFIERPPVVHECQPTVVPEFLYLPSLKIQSNSRNLYASCRNCAWETVRHVHCSTPEALDTVLYGHPSIASRYRERHKLFHSVPVGGITAITPSFGWSNIVIPDKQTLVADAGKLYVLDALLKRLKEGGHRVLIYSQMTRMIDLLEEYMWHRKHTYMRLDGSSKISERRDMVADFQSRADIFVFLLSTRAGGLGINLTAADTVIFYDSDWNPTVDQQAMDRAHRLGQTKQVTVYRLICKGTIEERILQRAREKSEIQRMVISGGNFKPDHLKPKEVVSLLLDDEEIEKKYNQRQAEKKLMEEIKGEGCDRKTKVKEAESPVKIKVENDVNIESAPQSPSRSEISAAHDDTSNDGLVVDVDGPLAFSGVGLSSSPFNPMGIGSVRVKPVVRGSRRGRPRGTRRGGCNAVRKRSYDADIKLPGEMFLTGESPSLSSDAKRARGPGVKRGPGRPRMKPYVPGARGTRGTRAPRRAPAPLQVPVARSSAASTSRPFGFYNPGPD